MLVGCGSENSNQVSQQDQSQTQPAPIEQKVEAILDVPKIADKAKTEVDKILGQGSDESEVTKYKDGLVEVNYIGGKAARITVNLAQIKSFSYSSGLEEALKSLGLTYRSPDFQNNNVTRWEGLSGMYEVSFFPGEGGNILYAYIITNEQYK